MPIVYFDASAFVKLLTSEPGSELALALWDGCDAAVSSRIAYPAVRAAVEQHAGHLARTHALRGADAVHLASALAIGDPELIFAVWDRPLHASAHAAGCRVAPAELDQ